MPRIDLPGPYRVHFFNNEVGEPPHVHVKRDRAICQFWPNPVSLAANLGFSGRELGKIKRLIKEHREQIEALWHEHLEG